MILLSDNELQNLLAEDVPYNDLTTFTFGISHQRARMRFETREKELVISCIEEVARLCRMYGLDIERQVSSGTIVAPKTAFLEVQGDGATIHKLWKTAQNLLDYSCGVTTYTHHLVTLAQAINPDIIVATTRKTLPFTKKIAIKAIEAGGAIAHRLGLSESILVFEYHRVFFPSQEAFAQKLLHVKRCNPEKKVVIEVENLEDGLKFASFGADNLQLEKFSLEELKDAVKVLREKYPNVSLLATGGININNIQEYAKCEVDMIVTSSPYTALVADIKVRIEPL
jgi:molybdenum transport protein